MYLFKRLSFLIAFCSLALLFVSCSDTVTDPEDESDNPNQQEFNSETAPGNSAQAFLQSDQYTDIEVEIDYMPNHEPTQEGLDSLRLFLEQRLNKQNITLGPSNEISAESQSSYTADDIRAIESEYRDNYTEAGTSTLHVYFLMVDGEFEQSNVLGIAYYNTSVAFFGQTIEEVSSGIGAPSEQKIEGTVFRHEFGHNMGLVGNGSPTQSDHKTDDSAHCTSDGCLMQRAVETGNFFENTFGGDIPDLDNLCIEDLQANGGK